MGHLRSTRLLLRALLGVVAACGCGFPDRAGAQTVSEFTIPTAVSGPAEITAGPDGALWFTEANGNNIGRITTTGTFTEFTVPTAGSVPAGITAGSDGALWFTENRGNKIGRITTTGTFTEFTIPTGSSFSMSITAGPDDNLWFAENGGNKIGRITTAGAFTEFTVPTANSLPLRITAGPDGNLWFIEVNGNKIGRITTAGKFTEFTVPTANSEPNGITAGPDGALWFTEASGNKIGRITTAGTFTEFTIPTASSNPIEITAGPDGALWFTEASSNKIGRITTSGVVTGEFPVLTSSSEPNGIAAGPDGGLWFTEETGSKIGTLMPAPPAQPSPLVAAILPSSRSVRVGTTATVFATIINNSKSPLTDCRIVPSTFVNGFFSYQTTDPATNALTGSPNTSVPISAGDLQTFVIAILAGAPYPPTNVQFTFVCDGFAAATPIVGVNTLLLTFDANPAPDVIALAATVQDDGIVHVTTGSPPTGAFAVATDNLGSGDTITVATNTGTAALPIGVTVCQTNPTTGQCLQTPAATVSTTINSNATPTFGIFVSASSAVPFDPATNRIFVTFTDSTNTIRGGTSVAVETQ